MDVMFSSKHTDWSTPQDFFDELDREFRFTLDPCATRENTKCDRYFTKIEDGIYRDWETDRKSTRLNSSHSGESRMPSSA